MRSLATGLVAISEAPQTTNTGTLIVASVSVSSNLNIASVPRARTPGEPNADNKLAKFLQVLVRTTHRECIFPHQVPQRTAVDSTIRAVNYET